MKQAVLCLVFLLLCSGVVFGQLSPYDKGVLDQYYAKTQTNTIDGAWILTNSIPFDRLGPGARTMIIDGSNAWVWVVNNSNTFENINSSTGLYYLAYSWVSLNSNNVATNFQYTESLSNNVTYNNNTLLVTFNTNYVSATGTVTRYTWVPSSGLRTPATKPATFTDRGDFGAWEFADGQEEQIVGNIMVPSDWDGTDNMVLCVGWESSTTNANCVWEIEWLYTAVDDDVTASGFTCLSTNESSSTAAGLVQAEVCTLTNAVVGDLCVHLRIMRDGNSAGDTLGAAAYLHGIALKYTRLLNK